MGERQTEGSSKAETSCVSLTQTPRILYPTVATEVDLDCVCPYFGKRSMIWVLAFAEWKRLKRALFGEKSHGLPQAAW